MFLMVQELFHPQASFLQTIELANLKEELGNIPHILGVKEKGKVLAVFPKTSKAIVEGVNVATKHSKPRRQGEEGEGMSN